MFVCVSADVLLRISYNKASLKYNLFFSGSMFVCVSADVLLCIS